MSAENGAWFLLNASPDLTRQLEGTPELQPHQTQPRNTPIAAVLLTNADLDHALGLLLMRQEETPLVVYTTEETRSALGWLESALKPFRGIEWRKYRRRAADRRQPETFRHGGGDRCDARGRAVLDRR